MTVGKAIETADKLRPNNGFDRELKILWLRQADAGLRKSVVDKSDTTDFDAVGADILYDREQELLRQDAELLLPEPYDSYYAHYLAAQMDAALGETDRYANEMQLANENQQEFAAWCRHTYLPGWPRSGGTEMHCRVIQHLDGEEHPDGLWRPERKLCLRRGRIYRDEELFQPGIPRTADPDTPAHHAGHGPLQRDVHLNGLLLCEGTTLRYTEDSEDDVGHRGCGRGDRAGKCRDGQRENYDRHGHKDPDLAGCQEL